MNVTGMGGDDWVGGGRLLFQSHPFPSYQLSSSVSLTLDAGIKPIIDTDEAN